MRNVRYKDNSFAKHRKAIAVALMNVGAISKADAANAPVRELPSGNGATGGDKQEPRQSCGRECR